MPRLIPLAAFVAAGAISLVSIAAAPSTGAATVTVDALKDAMIFGTSAGVDTGNASGMGPALFAGADGSSNKKRSLLEFDLASAHIPANATITNVTMTLYLAQVAGSGGGSGGGGNLGPRIFSLYDVLQNWSEGPSGSPTSAGVGGTGQGYPRQNGDTTWDYAVYNSDPSQAVLWNSGGVNLHGGNFSSTASATSTFTSFSTLNAPFTWSSDGMVADVQAWLSGSEPDYGWLLKSDNLETTATSFLGFWSKDGAAANNNPDIAPSLTITYTTTPEPAAASLMLVGGIALIGRRRRRAEAASQ